MCCSQDGSSHNFCQSDDLTNVFLLQELDFAHEAENADRCAANFRSKRSRVKTRIHIPKIYHKLTTKRVLSMEYINGKRSPFFNPCTFRFKKPLNRSLMTCMFCIFTSHEAILRQSICLALPNCFVHLEYQAGLQASK